jgi:hypothetical protein
MGVKSCSAMSHDTFKPADTLYIMRVNFPMLRTVAMTPGRSSAQGLFLNNRESRAGTAGYLEARVGRRKPCAPALSRQLGRMVRSSLCSISSWERQSSAEFVLHAGARIGGYRILREIGATRAYVGFLRDCPGASWLRNVKVDLVGSEAR